MSNDDSGGDDDGEKMKDTTNDHEMIILEHAIERDRKIGMQENEHNPNKCIKLYFLKGEFMNIQIKIIVNRLNVQTKIVTFDPV